METVEIILLITQVVVLFTFISGFVILMETVCPHEEPKKKHKRVVPVAKIRRKAPQWFTIDTNGELKEGIR